MTRHPHTLKLLPSEIEMTLPDGASLRQALEPRGVEFPCGGRGHCHGCQVRIVEGALRATALDEQVLTHADLAAGWRIACRHQVTADVALQVAQWETPLADATPGSPQSPREDLGIAIDLGTSTLAGQLVDLKTGHVLGVNCATNPQTRHGLDALSRLAYALDGGQRELQRQIREQLSHVVYNLQHGGRTPQPVGQVLIAANTIMHHLFCGVDLTPLAENPFLPLNAAGFRFTGAELGWSLSERAVVEVLPCLSGLAGGDTLAAIHACGMAERPELTALVDFGTSVEIVLGNRDRLLATTLDLGPLFEAGGITGGMRAAPGAIAQAEARPNFIESYVIGGGPPHGICGSGLVDAVAAGLQLQWVSTDGRLPMHSSLPLTGHFSIGAADVQAVLHAKATVVAALRVMAAKFGQPLENVRALYVSGAYGNCPSFEGAQRLGLLPVARERVQYVGDAALRGTRMMLVAPSRQTDAIRSRLEYVDLCGDAEMESARAAEMQFK
jgi:uncharacterized 2Fe-2S/4Fe-4S cluster protein (DUF4445 family)